MRNITKNKKRIIAVIAIIGIVATSSIVIASASDYNYKDAQLEMLEEAKQLASQPNIFTTRTTIGDVEGIPLYAEEIEIITARLKSMHETNPYKKALQHLKEYKHIEKLAIKYGITVSTSEIATYNNEQRTILHNSSDQEVKNFMKDYYAAMKMSEEEYWTIFKSIETRRLLLKDKVDAYLKNKGIKDIDSIEIQYTITDKGYQEKINGK